MTAFNRPARDRRRLPQRPARQRRLAAAAVGLTAALLLPGLAAAHPLGNFTINHYAGLRVEPDRILLDIVIDQAEIPAFQARLTFDSDGDGELSDAETDAGRIAACHDLATSLDLRVDNEPPALELTEAGLTFPPGAGGLSTMRSVCGFAAVLPVPLRAGSEVTFTDRSFSERLGWREIVAQGSGVTLAAAADGALRTSSPSNRLTVYPTDLLTQALADTQVAMVATPGGPTLPASAGGAPLVEAEGGAIDVEATGASAPGGSAAVPGGVGAADLPSIFRTADLTLLVLLLSILSAAALGAGHALTPGHATATFPRLARRSRGAACSSSASPAA